MNYKEIYTKNFDYDDMKIAICVADFCHISKKAQSELSSFEDIVGLAIDIRKQWEKDNENGNLNKENFAYIQSYANMFLAKKYLGE